MKLFKKTPQNQTHAPADAEQQKAVKTAIGSELVRAHITEKATDLAKKNQYVFVVRPDAGKKDIARSVAQKYGVLVEGVRVVTVHPKRMRLGRTKGVKSGYKKAIVQLPEGQKIEILPT